MGAARPHAVSGPSFVLPGGIGAPPRLLRTSRNPALAAQMPVSQKARRWPGHQGGTADGPQTGSPLGAELIEWHTGIQSAVPVAAGAEMG